MMLHPILHSYRHAVPLHYVSVIRWTRFRFTVSL